MRDRRPSFIVGIGGSAGALKAYKALLNALPANTGMSFVIVSHMLPDASSQLALILSSHTKMPVVVASEALAVWRNHVYVSPPNVDLRVKDYAFQVVSPRTQRNAEIDVFFTSLAAAMGTRAVGIIVSGYEHDGTEGCKRIKANGGTTYAQDDSAEVKEMPENAQQAGCIDLVLPMADMPGELQFLQRTAQRKG